MCVRDGRRQNISCMRFHPVFLFLCFGFFLCFVVGYFFVLFSGGGGLTAHIAFGFKPLGEQSFI